MPSVLDIYQRARTTAAPHPLSALETYLVLREAQRDRKPVIALDLDDTALSPVYSKVLAPLVIAAHNDGITVGVITGNQTDAAKRMYRRLYPKPDFYAVHDHMDGPHLAKWKAEQCQKYGVTVLVDDFKHGKLLDRFMRHKPDFTLPLVVPYASDAPHQNVGGESFGEAEDIVREVTKYDVPATIVPAVTGLMCELLDPEQYDPEFRGQDISSVYFDAPDHRLYHAKLADVDYVTVRIRSYPDGAHFLEAKVPGTKYRQPIDADQASAMQRGVFAKTIAGLIPEVADPITRMCGDELLSPVSTVLYRRYARETGSQRMTLDLDLRTQAGKTYPCPLLEVKLAGSRKGFPALDALGLKPVDLSKFTWSLDANR